MSRTLQSILIDSNSYLDLVAALPTGDDLGVRVNYAQQAVREWADSYRWKSLSTPLSVFVTSATVPLPSNLKELETILTDQSGNQYPEILPGDNIYKDSSDKYAYVLGNESQGFELTVNGLPSSRVSLSGFFQRSPSNMATLSDICEVPDDMYVVQKVISLVLQSRSDERFPTVEADAQRRLSNMIGRDMVQTPGGDIKMRRVGAATWRIGRSRG